jgi:hypothetical protein
MVRGSVINLAGPSLESDALQFIIDLYFIVISILKTLVQKKMKQQ